MKKKLEQFNEYFKTPNHIVFWVWNFCLIWIICYQYWLIDSDFLYPYWKFSIQHLKSPARCNVKVEPPNRLWGDTTRRRTICIFQFVNRGPAKPLRRELPLVRSPAIRHWYWLHRWLSTGLFSVMGSKQISCNSMPVRAPRSLWRKGGAMLQSKNDVDGGRNWPTNYVSRVQADTFSKRPHFLW